MPQKCPACENFYWEEHPKEECLMFLERDIKETENLILRVATKLGKLEMKKRALLEDSPNAPTL